MDHYVVNKLETIFKTLKCFEYGASGDLGYNPKIGSKDLTFASMGSVDIFVGQSMTTNIIVNQTEEDKKTKEKENKKIQKILAAGALSGLAFLSTWMFAKDDFLIFYRSDIDKQMNDLMKVVSENTIDPLLVVYIKDFFYSYSEWRSSYKSRTLRKSIGTLGCISSAAAGLSGFLLEKADFIYFGWVGTTLSGCCLLWNYLASNLKSEKLSYNHMMSKLNRILSNMAFSQTIPISENLEASAPF